MKALWCSTGKRNQGLSRPTPAHSRQKSAKISGRILDRPRAVASAPPEHQNPLIRQRVFLFQPLNPSELAWCPKPVSQIARRTYQKGVSWPTPSYLLLLLAVPHAVVGVGNISVVHKTPGYSHRGTLRGASAHRITHGKYRVSG